MSLWPCYLIIKWGCLRIQSCSQPSDFSRHPLGSRGSTSTVTLQAPSDSVTPLISPSWAQAFKVALIPPLLRDGAHGAKHLPYTALCGERLAGAGLWLWAGRQDRQWPSRVPRRWEICACVCCRAKGAVPLQGAACQRWGCLPL